MLGTFTAILAILTPIAALTYPIAIVLPKSDTDAKNIANLSIFIAVGVALLTTIVIITAGEWLAHAFSLETVAGFLFLIPVAMLFTALKDTFTQWLIRKRQFAITARVAVTQSFFVNAGKAGAGYFFPVGAVLIGITVIGQALLALQLWIGIRRTSAARPKADKGTGTMSSLAKQHRDFPLYRAPQVGLNAVSQSLPVLMLASFFGPAAAGFYSIGMTVLGIPSTLIGTAVGDVFYPRIAEAENRGENLFKLVMRATGALAIVGLAPYATVVVFGPELFAFTFGPEWAKAGEYASWIAVLMYFVFINSPSNKAIPVLRIQRFYLWFTVGALLTRAAGLAVGYFIFESDYTAIAIFGLSGAAVYFAQISIVLVLCKRADAQKRVDSDEGAEGADGTDIEQPQDTAEEDQARGRGPTPTDGRR